MCRDSTAITGAQGCLAQEGRLDVGDFDGAFQHRYLDVGETSTGGERNSD